ncbi:MAG: radical SAM protein [Pirellulaceae bacterium]
MRYRDHTFLGTTESLCPQCLEVVPAKIIVKQGRVYFRKRCPTHGERDDFVCSDAEYYDQLQFLVPARMPEQFGLEPQRGCPLDCGLCTDHEQHTCIGIVELTDSCNLTCPMCYAASSPAGKHHSYEECTAAIDRLVEAEGRPEVLQLSGGEPTLHPDFERILQYALRQPIDYVMINTNAIRLAHDRPLVELLAQHKDRVEIYFQYDGTHDEIYQQLRGQPLLDIKQRALANIAEYGIHVTLVCTLQGGVNDHEIGPIVQLAASAPHITGVSFQPATYSGRHVLPDELERRITFPDVIKSVAEQTDGLFATDDFMPLPCAHPNCHSIAYGFRHHGSIIPITRFVDARNNLDLLANGISFRRTEARDLLQKYLGSNACCAGGCCGPEDENGAEGNGPSGNGQQLPVVTTDLSHFNSESKGEGSASSESAAEAFFRRALSQELGAKDLLRITITSFLDAYNFDIRRVMKCCTHHVLPSGHVIPFCAYNVLYRNGHVALPQLTRDRETVADGR